MVEIISAVETKNWKIIKPFRNKLLLRPATAEPFKTFIGLKDHKKNDG